MAATPEAVVLDDGHGGGSGEHCCCCDRGCAANRWFAVMMTPANSLNGSGSGTGDQERGLHRGNAADSKMVVWALLHQYFLLLYLTNLVCHHLWMKEFKEFLRCRMKQELSIFNAIKVQRCVQCGVCECVTLCGCARRAN